MPAIQSEYEDAVKEGVKFEWKTTVEAFLKGIKLELVIKQGNYQMWLDGDKVEKKRKR